MSIRPQHNASDTNGGMAHVGDDPVSVVMAQDACVSEAGLDTSRWTETVFLPLTMVGGGKTFVIEDEPAFVAHLRALEVKANELGVVALRTRILSNVKASDDVAVISSIRDRLGAAGQVIGSTSVTWTVIRDCGTWKINQIMFNDDIHDPSVVSQVFLGRRNKG